MTKLNLIVFILISFSTVHINGETVNSVESTQKWVQLCEGCEIYYDSNYQYHPQEMQLDNEMVLRGENWESYLKNFVESFPIPDRFIVLNALSRYYIEYDKVDKVIKFEPLRFISGPYALHSCISVKGSVTRDKIIALIKLQYYGENWIFAEGVKVVADDFTWESPQLEFLKTNSTTVLEYAFLDISDPTIRDVINHILSSKETIIRFKGKQYYSDLIVTDRMKTDISIMLELIDKVNGNSVKMVKHRK